MTLPKIADELARLNTTLEPIAAALQALTSPRTAGHGSAGATETNLKAVLVQLARAHLPIDAVEPQIEALGLHETIASALGIALRAGAKALRGTRTMTATMKTLRFGIEIEMVGLRRELLARARDGHSSSSTAPCSPASRTTAIWRAPGSSPRA